MELTLVSEDSRRALYEFGEGDWKIAKYIEVKEDSVIGDHYHLNKDECFLLVEGQIEELFIGEESVKNINAPSVVDVPRGTYHKFLIKGGSKLIGLMSELYNKQDDHHV